MKNWRRIIKFATFFGMVVLMPVLNSCKGRTLENVEPTGDTIEVVIMQDSNDEEK